ncbi:DUF397 domain-containing protein [Streptomyces sp. NPDC012623]|uniref:DUF397 domain-containing protein n=1 Tax=unclassified Streptomyces TaxID=2593676 RepID=UPI0036A1F561
MSLQSELMWFKSSYSGLSDNDCVEVAATQVTVHVRDSKDVQLSHLGFGPSAWGDFVSYASER